MIVDHLAASQFWRSTTDGASAFLIWKAQKKRLDLERLAALAERRGVGNSVVKLRRFIEASKGRTSSEELERWANDLP